MSILIRVFPLFALVFGLVLATTARAETVAITNATIHTLTDQGTLKNATLVIKHGRIQKVGRDIRIPSIATRIDAAGKTVTPGLMDSHTYLSLMEIAGAVETVDTSVVGYDLGPGFSVKYGVNPASVFIPMTRVAGVTRAVVAPRSGDDIFAGQAGVIQLDTEAPLLVKSYSGQYVLLGAAGGMRTGGSRSAAFIRLKQALDNAQEYDRNRQSYARGNTRDYGFNQLDLEALVPVVQGKVPLVVRTNRAADIVNLLDLLKGYKKIKLVITGGREAWKVADKLAAAKVPVVLNPLDNLPINFDSLNSRLDNAALLQKAGVTIAFSSFSVRYVGRLRQLAGNAVAAGLDWEEALKAITVNPAKIWGLDKRYGQLKAGQDADVVIWSGDPLEVTSSAEQVFIKGQRIPMKSRQTELRDRYLDLSGGDKPFGYR